VVKVRVEDVAVIPVKPKISVTVYQYAILARDQFGHAKTFWVDADKYDKQKVESLIREYYAGRYGIPVQSVEIEWEVEPPRLAKT